MYLIIRFQPSNNLEVHPYQRAIMIAKQMFLRQHPSWYLPNCHSYQSWHILDYNNWLGHLYRHFWRLFWNSSSNIWLPIYWILPVNLGDCINKKFWHSVRCLGPSFFFILSSVTIRFIFSSNFFKFFECQILIQLTDLFLHRMSPFWCESKDCVKEIWNKINWWFINYNSPIFSHLRYKWTHIDYSAILLNDGIEFFHHIQEAPNVDFERFTSLNISWFCWASFECKSCILNEHIESGMFFDLGFFQKLTFFEKICWFWKFPMNWCNFSMELATVTSSWWKIHFDVSSELSLATAASPSSTFLAVK